MTLLLAFASTLLVAVLISALAHRTVISTAVLFLGAGLLVGRVGLDAVSIAPGAPLLEVLAELALFAVLFTDGMRVGLGDLRSAWRLPGRALLLGMPLAFAGMAVLGRLVVGLPWTEAFLVAAVLAPTDPVFAAALVGREEVPGRLRHLLNVESGVNDGLALPVVVVLLAAVSGTDADPLVAVGEAGLGIALGVAVPWLVVLVERVPFLSPATRYEPLNALAIGLLVLALASVTHANEFLAAFSAGVTVATVGPEVRDSFHRFGDLLTELLKLAALLVFGALISPSLLSDIDWADAAFVALVILAARPVALSIALFRSRMGWRERIAAAWFGPKGFASVVYGLLIVRSGAENSSQLFGLVAVVVGVSILAHSSTDVLVARWFREEARGEPDREPAPTR